MIHLLMKDHTPSTWRMILHQQMDQLRNILGKKEVIEFKHRILNDSNVPELKLRDLEETKKQLEQVMNQLYHMGE